MKLISLDPATHVTGYALWEDNILIQYGVIKAAKDEFDIRCLEINSKIRNLIVKHGCTECVAEFPEYQKGRKGEDAARAGDTLKLAFLCGSIALGWQLHSALYLADRGLSPEGKVKPELMPHWVTPCAWKGQLPKEITAQRCNKKFGWLAKDSFEMNASDAIMLGDWYLSKKGGVCVPTMNIKFEIL